MAFPKQAAPIFSITIPSDGRKVEMRPYLVGEERILYMALESEDRVQMATAIKQVLERCLITKLDVHKLAPFDLEYLFLRLRAKSVGEVTELVMNFSSKKCQNTDYSSKGIGCVQKIPLDLTSIEVERDPKHTNKVELTGSMGLRLRYPTAELLDKLNELQGGGKSSDLYGEILNIIGKCIELVYEGDEVYLADEVPFADVISFIESLTKEQMEKVLAFFATMPALKKKVSWTCTTCGANLEHEVKGLASFFTSGSVTTA